MLTIAILAFSPGFRLAIGDMGDVPEFVVGMDAGFGRLSLSLEMGRVVSGSFVDSSAVLALAEGGGAGDTNALKVTTYSSIATIGLRYAVLDLSGRRIYVLGGGGFQRPGVSADNYTPAGDDLTYYAGAGGDVLVSTFLKEGDFWKRTRLFVELRLIRLKATDPNAPSGYTWSNVPDWKVGVLMGF